MLMIFPVCWAFIVGRTAFEHKNMPFAFAAMIWSQNSTVVSSMEKRANRPAIPALLTRMSIRP